MRIPDPAHVRLPLAVALALCALMPLGATTPVCPDPLCVYVNNNPCDPLEDGTRSHPWCEIEQAYKSVRFITLPNGPNCPSVPADCKRYTILVMPGTYNECVTAVGLSNQDRPVRIVASAWLDAGQPGPLDDLVAPDDFDTVVSLTTIDGQGACDETVSRAPVVEIKGSGARLEGFKVTHGGKSGVSASGSVTITKNLIVENESNTGGGIYFYTGTCNFSGDISAVINYNKVVGNNALDFANEGFGDGGGIGVIAEKTPIGGCLGGKSEVLVADNIVYNNIAENPVLGGALNERALGGGIFAAGQSGAVNQETEVTITRNLVSGNSVIGALDANNDPTGFGGGIFALGFGYGKESFFIVDNYVGPDDTTLPPTLGNSANGSGGGISGWATSAISGRHNVLIDGNEVRGNTANRGAGIDLLAIAQEFNPCLPKPCDNNRLTVTASNNIVSENESTLDGGGIFAELQSLKVTDLEDDPLADPDTIPADDLALTILANEVRDNIAGLAGGGAFLASFADSDPLGGNPPFCDPGTRRAISTIDFHRNLVTGNTAKNLDTVATGDFVGPGVLADLQAKGDALAVVAIGTSTIASNGFDPLEGNVAFVGGLEFFANGEFDCNSTAAGEVFATVERMIVDGNDQAGIGGLLLPIEIAVTKTLAHGNERGDYEDFVTFPGGVAPPGNFDVAIDPLLEPITFNTPVCSPAFFVGSCDADPDTICFDDGDCIGADFCVFEGAGYLSNPDSNYDNVVDGVDLLRTIVSFGSSVDDLRYNERTDLNGSKKIEGNDLMYTADAFGVVCQP